jgi:hypothetical protein
LLADAAPRPLWAVATVAQLPPHGAIYAARGETDAQGVVDMRGDLQQRNLFAASK